MGTEYGLLEFITVTDNVYEFALTGLLQPGKNIINTHFKGKKDVCMLINNP